MVRIVLWTVALLVINWPATWQSPQASQQGTPPAVTSSGRGSTPVQGAEEDIPLVGRFDRNGDKRLDYVERTTAREYLNARPELRRPVRSAPIVRTGTPGVRLTPKDVKTYPKSVPLYDAATLRTFFVEFERDDWEAELAAFYHTDVQVSAQLTVDGQVYRDIGVSFRGNNSFTAVPPGLKRPLSLTIDFVHDQNLLGQRSLNLLNSNQDANEGFRTGGRAGGAAQPDPLTTLDDPNKALRHKLLAVPGLRDRYLKYIGDIAERWLDWNRLGPMVEKYQRLIAADVSLDTRKLDSTEAFRTGVYGADETIAPPASTIKGFADQRRAALLAHPDVEKARGR